MPSELFDPLLELAFSVAQQGNKKKPRIAPPQRLVPMLRFTRMPARARQTIHDVLDTDAEFRSRVLAAGGMLTALNAEVAELRDRATPSRTAVERRTRMPLPPGMHDDAAEALEYLLRIPGILVLVDGYNVTRTNHDDWPLEEQREWLARGLRNLSSRTSAVFDVVFDGADVGTVAGGGRDRGVSVRFSPEGVEADDVIIERSGRVDADRPVLVVSSDRRVQAGRRWSSTWPTSGP